jgi:hypothetical protein
MTELSIRTGKSGWQHSEKPDTAANPAEFYKTKLYPILKSKLDFRLKL